MTIVGHVAHLMHLLPHVSNFIFHPSYFLTSTSEIFSHLALNI